MSYGEAFSLAMTVFRWLQSRLWVSVLVSFGVVQKDVRHRLRKKGLFRLIDRSACAGLELVNEVAP
jgi:hypothetical protein